MSAEDVCRTINFAQRPIRLTLLRCCPTGSHSRVQRAAIVNLISSSEDDDTPVACHTDIDASVTARNIRDSTAAYRPPRKQQSARSIIDVGMFMATPFGNGLVEHVFPDGTVQLKLAQATLSVPAVAVRNVLNNISSEHKLSCRCPHTNSRIQLFTKDVFR